MSKLNISKGKWKVVRYSDYVNIETYDESNVLSLESFNYQKDEANAELIADAGNTYNKCGMLPSELLEELNKLKTK